MSSSPYKVRRAAVDDLPTLRHLWESMRLPVSELERRLTEFQVVEDAAGKAIGTLGFRIQGRHGHIHSEAFSDFSIADEVRPLFWTRIQSLVLNHGLARLWTQENTPFWTRNGFLPAEPSLLEKLPAAWGSGGAAWLSLKIKDEEAVISVEQEIDAWMKTERQRMAHHMDRAKTIRSVAMAIGIGLALLILVAAFYVYMSRPNHGVPQ